MTTLEAAKRNWTQWWSVTLLSCFNQRELSVSGETGNFFFLKMSTAPLFFSLPIPYPVKSCVLLRSRFSPRVQPSNKELWIVYYQPGTLISNQVLITLLLSVSRIELLMRFKFLMASQSVLISKKSAETHNSIKYEVIWKCQITLPNMKH